MDTGRSELFISPDSGESYVAAQFRNASSMAHVDNNRFIILDGGEGMSFMAVCQPEVVGSAVLFQAELSDGQFWYNLPYLRASCNQGRYAFADFQRLNSIDGVFILNTVDEEAYAAPGQETGQFISSRISFNKGAEWSSIPAPAGSACSDDAEVGRV